MPSAPLLSRSLAATLCRVLRCCDGNLSAVLLVGSGVYAPRLARDLDLVLASAAPRRAAVYESALHGVLEDKPAADILVRHADDGPGPLRLAIASGSVLWRRTADVPLLSAASVTPADFVDARCRLDLAGTLMESGSHASGDFAARFAQQAFETLFLASRTAVLAFLGSRVRRRLPVDLRGRFEALTAVCHVRYGCEARLPAGRAVIDAEFARWRGRTLDVIAVAEAAAGVVAPRLAAPGPALALPPMEAAEEPARYAPGAAW